MSPREIMNMSHRVVEWGEKWSYPFGKPEQGDTIIVVGDSSNGKSNFVMQTAKELCRLGIVLYESFEEGSSLTFQNRMKLMRMNEVQGKFRAVAGESIDDLRERLRRTHSPKFVIIDSFQMSGYTYEDAAQIVDEFPQKTFIWVSQAYKGQPLGKPAMRLWYLAGLKIKVSGYKATSPGRYTEHPGAVFKVWEQGIVESTLNS